MGVVASPRETPLPHQRLRIVATVLLVASIGLWGRYHFANLRALNDLTSEPDLAASEKQAQPLIDALEKYRSDNGLYPATLSQLSMGYLASPQSISSYRYSARHSDWVFQSDACIAREQKLRGWVLKEAKAYKSDVAQFKHDCITGYRDFQLQSPDFQPDAQSRYLERWAYYDSAPQHWALGWCEHVPSAKGRSSQLATNGVCRGRHRANDSTADLW